MFSMSLEITDHNHHRNISTSSIQRKHTNTHYHQTNTHQGGFQCADTPVTPSPFNSWSKRESKHTSAGFNPPLMIFLFNIYSYIDDYSNTLKKTCCYLAATKPKRRIFALGLSGPRRHAPIPRPLRKEGLERCQADGRLRPPLRRGK